MEIGQQHIDHTKTEARSDEYRRFSRPGVHAAIGLGRSLEQPQGCRPNRDNAPTARPGRIDRRRRCVRDRTPFRMHDVIVRIFDFHGQECPSTDMQCHGGASDPCFIKGRNQARGEMQPSGRGGHGARLRAPHGLLIGFIARFIAAVPDIGRQWCVAMALEGNKQIALGKRELQRHLAIIALLNDHSGKTGPELNRIARL